MEKDTERYKIFINTQPTDEFEKGYGIIHSNRSVSEIPENDFFVQFSMNRTEKIIDYVDTDVDDKIKKIERQEINPFYVEFGFFDNVDKIHINKGSDLSATLINYIRLIRPELRIMSNQEVRLWFNLKGKSTLPWTLKKGNKVTIDDLDVIQTNLSNVTSKAKALNITINK